MKEILYVQAGFFPNFTGTHFWNTQESYFTYEEDDEEPQLNHDISFREGWTIKGQPTYCPRVLIFDKKSNFGSLSTINGLYNDTDSAPRDAWTGDVVEYLQENIGKSKYHSDLEAEDGEDVEMVIDKTNVRYWSDYSRTFYHPRSVHKLPDPADWESSDGKWTAGKESFNKYNQEASLMEDSVRLFLEECDSIQGLQLIHDSASFGSFIDSFISEFRDDFIKLPIMSFFFLSEPFTETMAVDNSLGIRKTVNDALCLRSLNDCSTLNIPLLPPLFWPFGSNETRTESPFINSALLSAHLETATLPLRLKRDAEDLPSLCAQLNWRGDTRFAHLSGILPTSDPLYFDRFFDFSALVENTSASPYARRDVTRGFSSASLSDYIEKVNLSSLRKPLFFCTHALAYPMPSSFPSYIIDSSRIRPYQPKGVFSRSRSTSMMSSLTTTSLTSKLFKNYATFVEKCVQRKMDSGTGVEFDELRDLGNDLWTLHDNFFDGEHEEEFYIDGGMAEDD